MNLLQKTSPWITASILVCSNSFAQEADPAKKKIRLMPGYNASSRIEVDRSSDVFTSLSFTYWNPLQERMEPGIAGDTSDPLYILEGKMIDADFGFKPGFKIGLGINMDHDKWDTLFQYTWFRGTFDTNKSVDPTEDKVIYPSWMVPFFTSPLFYNVKQKWELGMDLLDWDLAKHYKVGKALSCRTSFGLRAAWIRQNLSVDYLDAVPFFAVTENVSVKQSSDSWAIGPRMGLTTDWLLGKGFRLYGTGSGDLLFTQYTNLKFLQEGLNASGDVVSGTVYSVKQRDLNTLKTHIELEIGLGWGTYFAKNKWHIDLSAGYNFQTFFSQNMFRVFSDANALGVNTAPNANLYMNGLTTNLRLDF